jgi:hypothetical protein
MSTGEILAGRARALQAQRPELSFRDAMLAVLGSDPELARRHHRGDVGHEDPLDVSLAASGRALALMTEFVRRGHDLATAREMAVQGDLSMALAQGCPRALERALGASTGLPEAVGPRVEIFRQAAPAPGSAAPGRLVGLELLRPGHWNNVKVSEADLHAIVAASKTVGFRPPLVLGHDARPDAPAAGWLVNLRVETRSAGAVLVADAEHVPPDLIEAIRGRRYDALSVELWRDLRRDGRTHPVVLRCAALLGAHPPAVAGLRPVSAALPA